MTTPSEIIRCLKADMTGDLIAAAQYAERIARNAALNPWSEAGDAQNYAEAAARLRAEYKEGTICKYCGATKPFGQSCSCWDNHCQ